jgi:hypothetical protein
MKERLVDSPDDIRPCDICGKKLLSYIDGKTADGPWANMCEACNREYGHPSNPQLATRFTVRSKTEASPTKDVVMNVVELTDPETCLFDGSREVQCPNCSEVRTMEPDADCVFECEGCQQKLRIRDIMCGLE